MFQPIVNAVGDPFYKITSEALLVTQQLVKVLRPFRESLCLSGKGKWAVGGKGYSERGVGVKGKHLYLHVHTQASGIYSVSLSTKGKWAIFHESV